MPSLHRLGCAALASLLLLSALSSSSLAAAGQDQGAPFSSIVASFSGQDAWDRAEALEGIGLAHPAFRCAGSAGANLSAAWILEQMGSMGMQAWQEDFPFTGWDLRSAPIMVVNWVDDEGEAEEALASFQALHLSASTGQEGVEGELVQLPMPPTPSYPVLQGLAYQGIWDGLNLTGKVALVAREARWNPNYESALVDKLREGPRAVVYYYSQPWSEAWEVMTMASSGGMPLSPHGAYLHDQGIPSGQLDAADSSSLLHRMTASSVQARVRIHASCGSWTQSNLVAVIPGAGTGERVMVTAHYDSVMAPGFLDNAAGVGSMLEMASCLAEAAQQGLYRPRADILFVAFTGEEMGMVGSWHYYHRHMSEMGSTLAVINLDCPGAARMAVTSTDAPDPDLDQCFWQEGQSQGLELEWEQGSSDHITFLHPLEAMLSVQTWWKEGPAATPGMPAVLNSLTVSSSPLSPLDMLSGGQPGWIHSSRDSSSFANLTGWVTAPRLQDQGRVTLSVLVGTTGAAPAEEGQDLLIPALAAVGVAACAILVGTYWLRGRRS